jgi:oligopeptide/dipeptide ABC transporter ATP-binding protein
MTSDVKLLDINNVAIGIERRKRETLVLVREANFDVNYGEMVGIVGESGSGKTMICRSIIGTLERRGAAVIGGEVLFEGLDLRTINETKWKTLRGKVIGYVPQSALAGPNPVLTIEKQLAEALSQVEGTGSMKNRSKELLNLVKIRRVDTVMKQYPYQLSGGMRQRVMIACALASKPKLLIADEPTTGLDVTVQSQIMDLLREIRRDLGTAIILISHDLALVDEVCDKIVVMHAGATVEVGPTSSMSKPRHPYTVALNSSRIDVAKPGGELLTIKGNPPSVGRWNPGCRFAERCDYVQQDCLVGDHPALSGKKGEHQSACLHADKIGNI